jgi:hypothetical protein
MHRHITALLAAAALAVPLVGTAAPATARPAAERPFVKGLTTPLSMAVTPGGSVWVSENFAGNLTRVRDGKDPRVFFHARKKAEVGAVSYRRHVVTFAVTRTNGASRIKLLDQDAEVTTLANISDFEAAENPDGGTSYGIAGLTEECAAQWPARKFGPASYPGIVESHPYATTRHNGVVYVADAAANAIFSVTSDGTVDTVGVLPGPEFVISAELAAQLGLPDCVVGETYVGEPVPTDIEVGPDGSLWVTTLGGGFGEQMPLGHLYTLDPDTGAVTHDIGDFTTPVGVALDTEGDAFVSQLFGNTVMRVPAGSDVAESFKEPVMPAALEYRAGRLWASTNVLAKTPPFGKIVSWVA